MRNKPHVAWVMAGVLAAVGAVGAGLAVLPAGDRGVAAEPAAAPPPPPAAVATAVDPARDDDLFKEYFANGVEYLREGKAHEALVSFHAASYLRPHVPETFVNIGYSNIALGNVEDAAIAFERALEINPSQANGYYGLAMALEALHRLEEALGAMRTFEHLLPKDEIKFRRLASSAIAEWETELKERRAGIRPDAGDGHGHEPPKGVQ